MEELRVIGTQDFMGKKIQIIEGGFGENQRIITAKEIADIHSEELKIINQSIKRLIEKNRIKENVHYIDLLSSENLKVTASDLGLITSNGQKNCFILSERGYTSLIKYMDDDKSWDVMDKLVDEYFTMREIIRSDEQLKAMYLLKAVESNGEESAIAIKGYVDIRIKEETKPLLEKIEEDKPMVDFAEQVSKTSTTILVRTFAKLVKDENINLGEKKLYAWLRNNKYLTQSNEPMQRYVDMGLFVVKERVIKTPYGNKVETTTYITGKGQIYLMEKLRAEFK